jgi:hypothetical protein
MATPLSEPSPGGFLGPDPGRSIRVWVALLLRVGIGLSLLSTGLAGYFGMQGGRLGGGSWGMGPSMSMLDPFMSSLPYLAIGLGLALILGFLTTASAIGAGFFSLILPLFAIVQIALAGPSNTFAPGGGWAGNQQFLGMLMSMTLPNLLTNAAMIWLSPLENHPYSVDALIFGRNEMEPPAFPPGPIQAPGPAVEPEPEPESPILISE